MSISVFLSHLKQFFKRRGRIINSYDIAKITKRKWDSNRELINILVLRGILETTINMGVFRINKCKLFVNDNYTHPQHYLI